MMDKNTKTLAETVWTRLDRKAGAIIELTARQLRHRISTWVVLGVGVALMALLLLFYVDSVRQSFEPIDNDGDSVDEDNDGYPLGQERKYGTSDFDASDYPGSGVYIPEDEIDWNDNVRSFSGNKSWNGVAFFEYEWIDYTYSGDWWDDIVDWESELSQCPEGRVFIDWNPRYGEACIVDEDEYFIYGKWKGNGKATVPEEWELRWGYYSQSFDVAPDPPEMYIDEDDIDCFDVDGNRVDCPSGTRLGGSHGFDNDGDCLRDGYQFSENYDFIFDYNYYQFEDDRNGNGIRCDVYWYVDADGNEVMGISADDNVDEDPNDERYVGELSHRTFIIGVGKMAFIILLGLFIPLFLSLGLVRDETENGTLHFLLSKPIHRGEFILYRLLGYLAIVASYVIILALIVGLITATLGPGDQLFRFSDLPVWLGIGISTSFVLAAYGSLFNTMGLISPKYGVYFCIIFGIWEFMMGTFSIINPNWTVSSISITHWALQMIDAIVLMAWPDTLQWAEIGEAFNIETGLSFFWHPPVHTLGTQSPGVALLVSTVVLSLVSLSMIGVGQSVFSKREIM